MWDYTYYEFKCPHCGYEYKRTVGHGHRYEYKDEIYDWYICPKCKEEFLGKYRQGNFIKMPEDQSELKDVGFWMS